MYKIDKQHNRIAPLDTKLFAELGFKGRDHLQEWIKELKTELKNHSHDDEEEVEV